MELRCPGSGGEGTGGTGLGCWVSTEAPRDKGVAEREPERGRGSRFRAAGEQQGGPLPREAHPECLSCAPGCLRPRPRSVKQGLSSRLPGKSQFPRFSPIVKAQFLTFGFDNRPREAGKFSSLKVVT